MQTATVAGLGELIESYRPELLSEWHREVDLFRGAEQLDAPTITGPYPAAPHRAGSALEI